ncbi:hypothetical protein HII31_09581 [Pseudocercospora fuligena]|uniref:Uncharacterized protein n=1 Tax=Pseudocercospora fuligena TaxID=685502 RepID=A0A8H6RCN5_9PEZI|nr:hypothetical protein HII31_09581 [Pseudocercospora fuligena]
MSSEAAESAKSTPPTSPEARDGSGTTEAMEKEEARMVEARRKEDEKRDKKMAAEREKDIKGGKEAVDSKYKALEYLLSQSKLYSAIMLEQMTQQEQADEAKDEKSKKRALKREETAEKVAQESQKRATRTAAATEGKVDEESPKKQLPKRGRPAKNTKSEKISDYMKKEDVAAKAGQTSISEALAEETKDADVKPGDIGELYQEILEGNSRAYLENKVVETLSRDSTPASTRSGSLKRKAASGTATPNKSAKSSRASTPATNASTSARSRNAKKHQKYEEVSDAQYFKQLDEAPSSPAGDDSDSEEEENTERAKTLALAKREISQKKLQNPKGRFRSGRGEGPGADFAELQRLLGKDDGERIDVAEGKGLLSDEDLAILTDRSPQAFERAEKGLDTVGEMFKAVQTKKDGDGLLESLQK